MEERLCFTLEEKAQAERLGRELIEKVGDTIRDDDASKVQRWLADAIERNCIQRDVFGLNPVIMQLQTAIISVDEIGLRRDGVLAILLYLSVINGYASLEELQSQFGGGVATIVKGLISIHNLYKKTPVVKTEDFRNLLVSFAEDMRVILIMIADRVNIMREIRDTDMLDERKLVSEEASYLYAPLAHKLGLYKLKSELEDLSLKYLEHDAYYHIREKLNSTKVAREKYIEDFIRPVSEQLKAAGLKFHIKGRTKSIHSIWQKMKKQKCPFEGVYDLFAIRIILDSELKREKIDCWQVYSLITDKYQPNPKRLRDWLSVPKSNGYESLHITVLGPENKWVEVQIRTERMDDIAEHGFAAHWRYKGLKGEQGGTDAWLAAIRSALEAGDNLEVMDQLKMSLYDKEVYVFSPKGDIKKFPAGATVLDFAYSIHSHIGNQCVGAKVNGKNVQMREVLHSGDTVEIMTSVTQKPKPDWMHIVKTSHARAKLRAALKEVETKDNVFAKELIERRLSNRKIRYDEATMQHTIKRLGYKVVSVFYKDVIDEKVDVSDIIDTYLDVQNGVSPAVVMRGNEELQTGVRHSAEEFTYEGPKEGTVKGTDDVLVIDRNLKGIDYSLAKCCRPIYGDDVFGFVTVNGGIKIHRNDCPNASELRRRFGYRVVKARWSGKGTGQYDIVIRVIGTDDLGIVNNITSIISKEERIVIRNINIDSNDGLFRGTITVQIDDTLRLNALLKKIRGVKGVKDVTRI